MERGTSDVQGKLAELIHELNIYNCHIVGIIEMRWKGIDNISTDEGHILYYNCLEDKNEQCVGIIVNKTITNYVLGCQAISSRMIYLRIKTTPFNATIIQVYDPQHIIVINTLRHFMNNFKLL